MLGDREPHEERRAAARLGAVLDRHGVAPTDLSITCRPLGCRYAMSFPSLFAMAELEQVPANELDERFVVSRPEVGDDDHPWVVVVYELHDAGLIEEQRSP